MSDKKKSKDFMRARLVRVICERANCMFYYKNLCRTEIKITQQGRCTTFKRKKT